MFICNICQNEFSKKYNLTRHLKEKRCKSDLLHDLEKLNNLLNEAKIQKSLNNNNSVNNNNDHNNNITNNDSITNSDHNNSVNSVNSDNRRENLRTVNNLNLNYIEVNEMVSLIDEYDTNHPRLTSCLSLYIKNIICNKEHSENHCIKYVDKRKELYSLYVTDKDGNNKIIIDTCTSICNIASRYFLDLIVQKLKKCIKSYKNNIEFENMYEDTICDLKTDLQIDNITKALKLCLQAYIATDSTMKYIM